MFDKNDPLIASVKQVMEQNAKERAATVAVNEKFGITSRKALPHERQGEWDAAYKAVLSEGSDPYAEQQAGSVSVNPPKPKLKPTATAKPDPTKGQDPYAEGQASSISTVKEAKVDHPNKQVLDVHEPEKDELTPEDFKKLRMKKILKRRFGKPGMESPAQSRREDK